MSEDVITVYRDLSKERKEPAVRVELCDGTNTWVTYVPLAQRDYIGAERAAGEAFAMFVAGLSRDRDVVNLRLREQRA
jgi:hypothetical protein